MSPETKAKISAANKGHEVSPETRAKISAANKGRPHPPVSAETRAKISAANKGRPLNPEQRAKLSAALKDRRSVPAALVPEFEAFLAKRRAEGSPATNRSGSASRPVESAARPASATWEPAVILGRPGKPARVWGKEKPEPTPLGRAVLKVLLKAGPNGLSASEIEDKCETGGWRGTLRRLKQSDTDWDSAILFPTKPYRPYRIANGAEP
jgi:hypothetical protein